MGSTYISLVNRLLRRFNEVQVLEQDFQSVRNIQAVAKDCIQDSIRDINIEKSRWPFNAYEYTLVLTPGVEEYIWPANFQAADWNSFQIQKDTNLNVMARSLTRINRDEWYDYRLKDRDDQAHPGGLRMPRWVSESHGNGFMITPSPNLAYTLKFRYYVQPIELIEHDDTTTIPSRFDNVIITNASQYMALFKGDTEMAQLQESRYKKLLANMIYQLLPGDPQAYDTRVNFGGNVARTKVWTGR